MNRCVDKLCLDGPPEDDEPRPRWATNGLLCRRCADRLEQRLAEAPARTDQLRAILGGTQSPPKDGSRHTKGSPPIPLNLPAHDLLELMRTTLGSWMRLVAEERDLRGPDRDSVQAHSSWLLGQLDWLVEQPWVDDLADEVRDMAKAADGMTQVKPGWHTLAAPCPGCGGPSLGRWDGDDHVGCGDCGERWPEDEYPRLVKVLASDSTWSLTAAEAAARAGVDPQRFRQWVSRGHVRRLGTVDGQARYSTQDVDEMGRRSA